MIFVVDVENGKDTVDFVLRQNTPICLTIERVVAD